MPQSTRKWADTFLLASHLMQYWNLTSRLVFTAWLCPSSERPRASIAACRRAAGSITISRRSSRCCSNAIAGIAIGVNFKIYLLHQFCSNRVQFFYNTQETQMQKNDGPEFWNSNSVIFKEFFWNFQKGVARSLCGRSEPLWSQPN